MLMLALIQFWPNTSRRPTCLLTLKDLLLFHRAQQYKEPLFIDLLYNVILYDHLPFFHASTRNRSWATSMGANCLDHQTMLSLLVPSMLNSSPCIKPFWFTINMGICLLIVVIGDRRLFICGVLSLFLSTYSEWIGLSTEEPQWYTSPQIEQPQTT